RLLAPVDVVEDTDERLLRRRSFEQLPERPGDLLARADDVVTEQRADPLRRRTLELDVRQLLDDLDDRPVGDALAVGQTPAPNDSRLVQRGQELGRESRLADAGAAEDREQLAR